MTAPDSLLGRLLGRLLAYPRALLAALLVLSGVCVPLLLRINLQGDLVDLLPRSSTAARAFATFNRQLAAGQELIVLATCADPARLTDFAERYAAALAEHPEVQQVTYRISPDSLRYLRDHLLLLLNDAEIDELGRRLLPDALRQRAAELRSLLSAPGGSAMAPLLTADPLELTPLITARLSSGLQVDARSGYLRTADGTALLIKIRPRFAPLLWERSERLVSDLGALAVRLGGRVALTHFEDGPTPQVSFTGSYAFPPYFRRWLEQDMTRSTVLSVGAVLLLFGAFFRSLRILPVVLLPLSLAGLWTAAAAGLLFGRISGVSMAFATILVAIGIDVPIQLYTRLREELVAAAATGQDHREVARQTICNLASPSIVATLGPAAVFFCCGLSDFGGLNQLGILAGLGLCLNCVAMLTVFPALLLVLPRWAWLGKLPAAKAQPGQRGLLAALGRLSARRPRPVLLAAAALFVVALPFLLRAGLGQELLSMDMGGMPPALTQQEVSRRFGEHQRFLVALVEDKSREQAMQRADLWLDAVEGLRQRGLIRGYEALGTLVPSAATQAHRRQRLQQLDLLAAADRLAAALDAAGFDPAPFHDFLAALRNAGSASLSVDELQATELGFLVRSHLAESPAQIGRPARALVALFLFVPADHTLNQTLDALAALTRGPAGGALTGLPLLEHQLRTLLARDLQRITGLSVAAVALLLLVYYRRARPLVAVLLPLSLAWVLFGAALYLLHLPLHLYNLLSVPLVIGYGIDDHIFLVHRHLATPASERDPALVLATTGRAIVLTTLSTMAGFLGLLPAHFLGLRQLGLCGALAVLLCLLAAFLVLPALLALLWPKDAAAAPTPHVAPR
jgi:predicted RND superfamily exporter protein